MKWGITLIKSFEDMVCHKVKEPTRSSTKVMHLYLLMVDGYGHANWPVQYPQSEAITWAWTGNLNGRRLLRRWYSWARKPASWGNFALRSLVHSYSRADTGCAIVDYESARFRSGMMVAGLLTITFRLLSAPRGLKRAASPWRGLTRFSIGCTREYVFFEQSTAAHQL